MWGLGPVSLPAGLLWLQVSLPLAECLLSPGDGCLSGPADLGDPFGLGNSAAAFCLGELFPPASGTGLAAAAFACFPLAVVVAPGEALPGFFLEASLAAPSLAGGLGISSFRGDVGFRVPLAWEQGLGPAFRKIDLLYVHARKHMSASPSA